MRLVTTSGFQLNFYDHLNNYFCSVGEKLAANIKTNKNDFVKYCNKQSNNSMFCDPITPDEIASVVSTFSNNKSPGPDNIGPKLLKYF